MSFWGQEVNNFGAALFGTEYLRDYAHAAKVFRPNGYQYSPKFKFLFHVYFDIDPIVYPVGLSTGANFGLAVKTVKLPSLKFDTHVMNQYNRKRVVQTKVKYDPIDISFHDDNGNLIRNLLYYYYLYYYNDSNKPYLKTIENSKAKSLSSNTDAIPTGYNYRNIYQQSITGDVDWGYIGESAYAPANGVESALGQTKPPFFKNITVYGFNQHNFVAYTLVNPILTGFDHDTYSYAETGGTMEHKVTVDYETVKYYEGSMAGRSPSEIVTGFGMKESYDKTLSPLAKPGSQNTVFGQGGLVDAGAGILKDLAGENPNYLSAIIKAGTAYNTAKNMNVKQTIKSEVLNGISTATNPNAVNRNVNFLFPVFGQSPYGQNTPGNLQQLRTSPSIIRNILGGGQ